MKGIHIGEVLVEQGAITKEQLNEGLKQLKAETNDRRLAEVLTDLGYVTDRELMEVLGRSMGLEVIDLEFFHIDERAVEKIPKQLAIKYNIMAVSMEGSCLTVATGGSSGFICAGGYPSGDQYENPADSGGTDADPPRD